MGHPVKPPIGQPSTLATLELLELDTSYRTVWRWLATIGIGVLVLLFLPWQQTVQGTGIVTALAPQDRPQVLPSRINGRVERWLVDEGAFVKAGTPLVELSEVKDDYLDPDVLARTREQMTAKAQANRDKQDKVAATTRQIAALEQARALKREQLQNKVALYTAAVAQAALDDSLAQDQWHRRETLYASPLGLTSLNDLQAARLKAQTASAKLIEKRNELANARVDLDVVDAELREKIEKARGELQATRADIQEGTSEVSKLRSKVSALAVRRGYQRITAPRDGYVVRAIKQGVGDVVKAGDPVVTLQPAVAERAVSLQMRAVDVPLLRVGRMVRIEFDGWPALQFSGWPSVSVGTFGGRVAVIDQVAGPDGTFRVLVTPDPAEPWPVQLRMGSGVKGWAALNTVRVWFELWRQLNGFAPTIAKSEAAATGGAKK